MNKLKEALHRSISVATGRNPGYGVKPLKDNSKEEQRRFKTDYYNAMKEKFGDDELAFEAFTYGPGTVLKRLKEEETSATNTRDKPSKPNNLQVRAMPKQAQQDDSWEVSTHTMPQQGGEWEGSAHVAPKSVSEMGGVQQFLTGVGGEVSLGALNLAHNVGIGGSNATLKKQLDELSDTDYGHAGRTVGAIAPYMIGPNTLINAIRNGGIAAMTEESPTSESTTKDMLTSIGGYGVGKALGGLFTPTDAANKLMRQGVQPTVGQATGGLMDKAEQLMGKSFVLGGAVKSARKRTFDELGEKYTNAAASKTGVIDAIFTLNALLNPHITLPTAIAAHIGAQRPVQKFLLGGYPFQNLLGKAGKAGTIGAFEPE